MFLHHYRFYSIATVCIFVTLLSTGLTNAFAQIPDKGQQQPNAETPSDSSTTDTPEPAAAAPQPEGSGAETGEPVQQTELTELKDETAQPDQEKAPSERDQATSPVPDRPDKTVPTPQRGPIVAEPISTESKKQEIRRELFLIGVGIGAGFFSPGDVNEYLEMWAESRGDIVITREGFSEMIINVVPRITATYIPIEYVQLQLVGEIGWAPKTIRDQYGHTEWFHFTRFSPGLLVNFHLPVNANRQSIFIGAGALYHWMSFDGEGADFSANTLGGRIQLGYRFYVGTGFFVPEVVVAADYAEADAERGMNLNYSGVILGGNFYFDLRSAFR